MTPFGIRKKLKGLLNSLFEGGSSEPAAPTRPVWTVTFEVPDGSSFTTEAKDGDSLVLAAGRGPQPIATGCSDGTCATCRVDVLAGLDSLTPQMGQEEQTKSANKVPTEQRLGCQTGVVGPGVRVHIVNVFGEEPIDP